MTTKAKENTNQIIITGFKIADKRYETCTKITITTSEACDAFSPLAKFFIIQFAIWDDKGGSPWHNHWLKGHKIQKFNFRTKAEADAYLPVAAEAVRDLLREKGWMK